MAQWLFEKGRITEEDKKLLLVATSGSWDPDTIIDKMQTLLCAIYEKDVESVCGGDPKCGGVVCKPEYAVGGHQYCLARWAIDETATDEESSTNRAYSWAYSSSKS